MSRPIEVHYNHKSDLHSHAWLTGSQRFTDWFDFADWLKQRTLKGPVLITHWEYV